MRQVNLNELGNPTERITKTLIKKFNHAKTQLSVFAGGITNAQECSIEIQALQPNELSSRNESVGIHTEKGNFITSLSHSDLDAALKMHTNSTDIESGKSNSITRSHTNILSNFGIAIASNVFKATNVETNNSTPSDIGVRVLITCDDRTIAVDVFIGETLKAQMSAELIDGYDQSITDETLGDIEVQLSAVLDTKELSLAELKENGLGEFIPLNDYPHNITLRLEDQQMLAGSIITQNNNLGIKIK
ncbi:hypothetical protein A6E01_18910 (plasmid) [Vibrio breoganii]|uniref:Flagellar motor switch protein FliN-like C-terminal domain-containing protein n=1 Tax=Vibrio breoganii TaxID=553239 RepID=A0AAN1CU84_9VIBR|nr:FliM/FliN family flagellar motor C-terminal domain-containing protein [Vibrio breoganii]ANO35287.1 hypothetical protein A6E01_18910 [Vibrio breoganii]